MIPRLLSKRRDRRAELQGQRLTSLINSMADGVLAVDNRMNIVIYNGAALNILDVNSSMHGQALDKVLHVFDHNNQPVDILKLVRETTTTTSRRDLLLHYQDKSTANLYISVAPVHFGYGQDGQRGFVLLLRDITREKSLEEERDEFISVVSHELRTPIAIAEGNISNAQLIAGKLQDIPDIQKALQEAHNQIMFLASMVNDLATLSRAERDRLTVEVEKIDVNQLVGELVSNYTASANEKQLKIHAKLPPTGDLSLYSSRLYVREVLQNFITNAIKYTEKGSVTIEAKAVTSGVQFNIADTGIGISKSDQEKIFDKFFRSEDYRTRKTNGTGLGLYITLKLARLLHAEIEVTSKLNVGSTFSIVVPNIGPAEDISSNKTDGSR